MKITDEQLKQIFEQRTARSTGRQVDCLTEDQFARAASGAMDQQERSVIARHLIYCADCIEEYRIVRSLKPWANEADQAVAAALQATSRRDNTAVPTSIKVERLRFWNKAFFSPSRAALPLAATFFLVLFAGIFLLWNKQDQSDELARLNQQLIERDSTLGSVLDSLSETQRRLDELEKSAGSQASKPDQSRKGETETPFTSAETGSENARLKGEIASLRRSARELARPQLEVPIIDLDPTPVRGGSGGAAVTIDIPPTANSFTLILNFSEDYPAYVVEILTESGSSVWRGQILKKGEARNLNLTLWRMLMANGNYLIKLHGLKDGVRQPVAEYPIRVHYQ